MQVSESIIHWRNSDGTSTVLGPDTGFMTVVHSGVFNDPYGWAKSDIPVVGPRSNFSFHHRMRTNPTRSPAYELQYRHCNHACPYCAAMCQTTARNDVAGTSGLFPPAHDEDMTFTVIINGGEPLLSESFQKAVIAWCTQYIGRITNITVLTSLRIPRLELQPLYEWLITIKDQTTVEWSITLNGSPSILNSHASYISPGFATVQKNIEIIHRDGFKRILPISCTNKYTLETLALFKNYSPGILTMQHQAEYLGNNRASVEVLEKIQNDHNEFHEGLSGAWDDTPRMPYLINNGSEKSLFDLFNGQQAIEIIPYVCVWPYTKYEWVKSDHIGSCKKCTAKTDLACLSISKSGCGLSYGSPCLTCPVASACYYTKAVSYDCVDIRSLRCDNIRRDVCATVALRCKDLSIRAITNEFYRPSAITKYDDTVRTGSAC